MEVNNRYKCQVHYSELARYDDSAQLPRQIHDLIFLHVRSLNPGAECWPVKEHFCFRSVKTNNHMKTIWLTYSVCFWNVWFLFSQTWLERCPFSIVSLLQRDVQTRLLESKTTGMEWKKIKNTSVFSISSLTCICGCICVYNLCINRTPMVLAYWNFLLPK